MKITYSEFKKAIQKADAVMVDGNLTFPDVQEDGRIDFFWSDSDGGDYRYYAEDIESFDVDLEKDVNPLTIELGRNGSFVLSGLYSDDTDDFYESTTVVQLLMVTPYKKKGKK